MKFIGLLITGAAAASMRSTVQMRQQLQNLALPAENTAGIEDTLMNLLADGSGNTPELAAFVKSIKELLDTQMKTKIVENKNNQQKLVNSAFAQFESCSSKNSDAQAKLTAKQNAFPGAAAAHSQCRQRQSTTDTASKTCESTLVNMESTRDALCKDLQALEGQSPTCTRNAGEAYRDFVSRQNLFFANALSSYDQKKKACADATAAAAAQKTQCISSANELAKVKSQCDDLQGAMDSGSCDIGVDASALCKATDSCYSQSLASYNSVVKSARAQEAGLKTEFEAVLRLGCLTNVFAVADDSRGDAIAACKAADYSKEVAALSLTYPGTPAAPSCSLPSGLAGSAAYKQAQYDSLPKNAPAKQCTASCCAATPTWTLLASHDSTKCYFSQQSTATFLENDSNPQADCYMQVGKMAWDKMRGTDGKFKFKATFQLVSGGTRELLWKQSSIPMDTAITGFEALNDFTRQSSSGAGPNNCVFFRGFGKASASSWTVLDDRQGNCWWYSIGQLKDYSGNKLVGPGFQVFSTSAKFWVESDVAPTLSWTLLASHDSSKCYFSQQAVSSFLENAGNPQADCYMQVGNMAWDKLRGSDGKFLFKATFQLVSGGTRELLWKQSSTLMETSITGFEALNDFTKQSSSGAGPNNCVFFRGFGKASASSWTVLDDRQGNCWWYSIGQLKDYSGNKLVGPGFQVFSATAKLFIQAP